MKAVCFVNGFRERIVQETGGLEGLDNLFDFFIDTSAFMKPWETQREFEDAFSHKKLVAVNDEKELESVIRKHNISYILFVGLEDAKKISEVLKLINAQGVGYGLVNIRKDFYNFFYPDRSNTLAGRLKKRLKKIKTNAIASVRSIGVPAPVHVFTNETKALTYPKAGRKTIVKKINYRDYYLSSGYSERPFEENYAVFLDQAYPYFYSMTHGIDRTISFFTEERTELYYKLINGYLKKLSDELNLRIVICQHPNSPRSLKSRFLEEFIVVKYESGKYARFADVIVTHDSNSLSYGYMYDIKTVSVVFESAMHKTHIHDIKLKAKMQGITLHYWPSDDISFNDITPPSDKKIKNFILPNKNSVSLIDEFKEVINTV